MRLKRSIFWIAGLCKHSCNCPSNLDWEIALWIMTSDTFWDPQKSKLRVCPLLVTTPLPASHGRSAALQAASPWPLRRLFLHFGEVQTQRENCDFCHSGSKHWHQMTGSCFCLKCCRQHIMGKAVQSFTVRSPEGGKSWACLVMHKLLCQATVWGRWRPSLEEFKRTKRNPKLLN